MSKILFTDEEWTWDRIKATWEVIKCIGTEKYGLDIYDINFEMISSQQMIENYTTAGISSYYTHWSLGKHYDSMLREYDEGEMGLAYEIIVNTDPTICYLMENNSMTCQMLVMSHACFGHANLFKNHYLFKEVNQSNFIIEYCSFADRYITQCEVKYGEFAVMATLDVAHSLKTQSFQPKRNPLPKINFEEYRKEWQDYIDSKKSDLDIFTDTISRLTDEVDENTKVLENKEWAYPEYDFLYCLEKNFPNIPAWKREIFRIVRVIEAYFYPQILTKVVHEGWSCVEGSTEYLSPEGWVRIDEYQEGTSVAQYTEDGALQFVVPDKYIVTQNKELLQFTSEHIDQCVTPDHRMIYKVRDKITEKLAEELDCSTNRYFIPFGQLEKDTEGLPFTDDELRIIVAQIADGHFDPRKENRYVQFGFVKTRKIERLEMILNRANITYNKEQWSQERTAFNFFSPLRTKSLSSLYQANRRQLEVILEEVSYWDSHKRGKNLVYYSVDKSNIDFIQYALIATGHKARITTRPAKGNRNTLFVVEQLLGSCSTMSGGTITKLEGKHTVYCFSLPSGMFITRRNGKVSVTGNCFWQKKIIDDMYDEGYITETSYFNFLHLHNNVVADVSLARPEYRVFTNSLNPYYLGFHLFTDIERICKDPNESDLKHFPTIAGKSEQWLDIIKDAAYSYRDSTFIYQFLSPTFMKKQKLMILETDSNQNFAKVVGSHEDEHFEKTKALLAETYNKINMFPDIYIEGIDHRERFIAIGYKNYKDRGLHKGYSDVVLEYIRQITGYRTIMSNYPKK